MAVVVVRARQWSRALLACAGAGDGQITGRATSGRGVRDVTRLPRRDPALGPWPWARLPSAASAFQIPVGVCAPAKLGPHSPPPHPPATLIDQLQTNFVSSHLFFQRSVSLRISMSENTDREEEFPGLCEGSGRGGGRRAP